MASLHESQKLLKIECEELWEELRALQSGLNEDRQPYTTQKESSLSDIYKKKEQLLNAHLEAMKDRPPLGPSSDKNTQISMITEDLKKNVKEFEETLIHIIGHRKQIEQDVQLLTQQVSEQRQIQAMLEERVQKTTESVGVQSEAQVIQEFQSDKMKVDNYHNQVMKQMAVFMRKHFPRADKQRPFFSLLEKLMNKCIESPHAPYVEATDAWQPYIELLLRTGIAIKHTGNDKLLRLTPYHL